MTSGDRSQITRLLGELGSKGLDDAETSERVFRAVYAELRRLASDLMRSERPDHTLQPTALVNEAYLRLVGAGGVAWESRAHFFGIAARAMRQILVDHCRRRAAAKRGGAWQRVTLDDELAVAASSDVELVELDDSLTRLAELDERMARIVELRVFAGLSIDEVAHVLEVSRRTILYDWRVAKLWLRNELGTGDPA